MVANSTVSAVRSSGRRRATTSSTVFWIVQGLLAVVFLFAGGMKLVMPIAMLTSQFPLPGAFMRFIGVAEISGALGLILPGLLRIRPGLTPLAASGLVLVMVGATTVTVIEMSVPAAVMPLVVGLLAAFVAYGRSRPTTRRRSRVRRAG